MSASWPVFETPHSPVGASRERVDVWQAELDTGPLAAAAEYRLLSAAERARAARLRVGAGRWIAARAALRRVLGRYLDQAPERIAFTVGAGGKPALGPTLGGDLRFNLSHSGAVALIAVGFGREGGVDVEQIRNDVDGAAIARELFAANERIAMAERANGDGGDSFFAAWVCREALAKAAGGGIAHRVRAADTARFRVRELDGIPGYAAAVASEGAGWCVARMYDDAPA